MNTKEKFLEDIKKKLENPWYVWRDKKDDWGGFFRVDGYSSDNEFKFNVGVGGYEWHYLHYIADNFEYKKLGGE